MSIIIERMTNDEIIADFISQGFSKNEAVELIDSGAYSIKYNESPNNSPYLALAKELARRGSGQYSPSENEF